MLSNAATAALQTSSSSAMPYAAADRAMQLAACAMSWASIFSGAIAAALALILLILGLGLGGYLAGRLRTKWVSVHADEVYFRDTGNGFLGLAVAALVTAGALA